MTKTVVLLVLALLVLAASVAAAKTPTVQNQPDRSWADRLEYVGVAVKDPDYRVWGSSPVVGPEGETHLFVARWLIKDEFKAWCTHGEIASYVSDRPEGLFVFKGSGRQGKWSSREVGRRARRIKVSNCVAFLGFPKVSN